MVVTTCATSGTDAGVDWVADIALEIAEEERLTFTMAKIYSELTLDVVSDALAAGRVSALEPAGELAAETIDRCEHIVGLMGHEPITDALAAGADLVLAGRASDTASVAGIALGRGIAPGPTWHAAKTVECGSQCTTDPIGGGVLVEIDDAGFTVYPLTDTAAATPMTVAAHMLYENADPFRLREPGGTLDTSAAVYTAVNERVTRVEGSIFEAAEQATIKLEGAALGGYETVSLVGIRDPHVVQHMDAWLARFAASSHAASACISGSNRASTTPNFAPTATTPCSERSSPVVRRRGRWACCSAPAPQIRPPRRRSRRSRIRSCSTCLSRA